MAIHFAVLGNEIVEFDVQTNIDTIKDARFVTGSNNTSANTSWPFHGPITKEA